MEKDIFISHSSLDKEFACRLAEDLRAQNVKVWLDAWDIEYGADITSAIGDGLKNSSFLLVILTENSIKSKWVEVEWRSKFGEEVAKNSVKVIPTVIGRVSEDSIPLILRGKKRVNLSEDYMSELHSFVQYLLDKRKNRFQTKLTTGPIGELLQEGLVDLLENQGRDVLLSLKRRLQRSRSYDASQRLKYVLNEIAFHYDTAQKEADAASADFENDPDKNFAPNVLAGRMAKRVEEIKNRLDYIVENQQDPKQAIEEIEFEVDCQLDGYEQKREKGLSALGKVRSKTKRKSTRLR